jgi:tryptophan synthase alpha chain
VVSCADRFSYLKAKGSKALVLYLTAGDPSLAELGPIMETLAEGGADFIEVGLPFSDPVADGKTIQGSSQRALERGVTPMGALKAVAGLKLDAAVLAMGYYNSVLRIGLDKFAEELHDAGVCATILSDLTPEESDDWVAASRAKGLENVFLVAPTSTDERLAEVCRKASGFVYAVSRTGVTGAGAAAPQEVLELVSRVKAHTQAPVCVGFGISTPDDVRMVCRNADGAVIGSALVDWLAKNWQSGKGRAELLRLVKSWKEATRP